MKCVILQPSYIPWRGYFDQIRQADVFVFYDDVQYDKHGWRNRNRIKTHQGPKWLTIPVLAQGVPQAFVPINAIRIDTRQRWHLKHWNTVQQAYSKAPYFQLYAPILEEFYVRPPELLADFTIALTIALAQAMGIHDTRFLRASSLNAHGHQTDRLIEILKCLGASDYLSGPSARAYIQAEKFVEAGINLSYMDYSYPPYPQLYPPYEPQVSILDLLFMTGPRAFEYF